MKQGMARTIAVGIDLGTTNSAVAYVTRTGRTAMLANELGETLTPSMVQFEAEETIVGREALKAAIFDLGRVASAVKRDMGSRFYSRAIHGKQLAPEVIQACLLEHFKELLDEALPAPYCVVITVPAFFDEQRRKATEDAGRMAGFSVLDIVNEPTAAALAYGEQLGYLAEDGSVRESMRLLVYDLGGGTFDVTLMQLEQGSVRVLATDGDVRLGGLDFDARLADYACQKFEDLHRVDPRQDPTRQAVLQRLAEEVKQSLSQRDRARMRLEYQRRVANLEITRRQFEGLTADLLERTAFTTAQVLEAAALSWREIDRVLLVGGSTRMPMVERLLTRLSGRVPDRVVNPDEAVARGAAIYAAYLLGRQGESAHPLRFRVVDVNSHSLGVEGIDLATGRRQNTILIPRNTPLPTTVSYRFVTNRPDQENVSLKLLEGESPNPDECIPIGRALLREMPEEIEAGHPIDVLLKYDASGRLNVRMQVQDTAHKLELQLQRGGGLSPQAISAWQQLIVNKAGMKSFEQMLEEVLGMADDRSGR